MLPEVYWMNARSSGAASRSRGGAPSASSSLGSRIIRTLGASATLWSTPGRNQPTVATATASESRKTLPVASTPSVG